MKNFDDFKFISEEKLIELNKAYNYCLKKVKINNYDADFKENIKSMFVFFNESIHILNSLINNSLNKNTLNILKKGLILLQETHENLLQIYDIEEVDKLNENIINNSFEISLKKLIEKMLEFLKIFFNIIKLENNSKIINSLNIIYIDILNFVIDLNNINFYQMKVFSIFKKH